MMIPLLENQSKALTYGRNRCQNISPKQSFFYRQFGNGKAMKNDNLPDGMRG
jgi:hypothetical protein